MYLYTNAIAINKKKRKCQHYLFFGMRFFFYSNEYLPIYIHVPNADGEAKFEVNNIKLVANRGIKNKDLKMAEAIIEENKEIIINKWNEYHGD